MLYLFQLGHQPHISTAELEAVFSQRKISYKEIFKNNEYLILEIKKKLDTDELINQLGGIIKIGEEVELSLVDYLKTKYGKIIFSINDQNLGINTKKELKSAGLSARYVEPKNTATILHNNLVKRQTDLTVVDKKLFYTSAIQPFEAMGERDFDRPGSDDKSGMLPPKLAKIMINLSLVDKTKTILDPFCGSGTVLTEAMVMGYKYLLGSDISPKAVDDTEKNILWIKDTYQVIDLKYKLHECDATQLHQIIIPNSISTIVTEPYLGKPLRGNENKITLQKQANELAKLYIESFKSFYKILKDNGTVVIVIPQFRHQDEWIKIDCIKTILKSGFAIMPFDKEESLLYHRPKQHVGRTIYRFKKT
ncbi:MAG: DNA methyltransferase [Candidatus Magasanikiibacteriota bacterium]